MIPTNFDQADVLLTGRCKDSRKVGNNTYLQRRDNGDIAVKLHNTDVVTYKPNGDCVLNSGGWRTPTTKERINLYAPIRWLSQVDGVWWVTTWDGGKFAYDDGMVIKADGSVKGSMSEIDIDNNQKEAEKIRRQIRKFVNSITPEQVVQAWENTDGDCWLCKFGTGGCEADHLDEGYFHATLVHRAVMDCNFLHPDYIMQMIYSQAQRGIVDKHFLKDTLARYLRKQLLSPLGLVTR